MAQGMGLMEQRSERRAVREAVPGIWQGEIGGLRNGGLKETVLLEGATLGGLPSC